MAVSGEKCVTSGLEKGDNPKTIRYNPIILYFNTTFGDESNCAKYDGIRKS